MFPGRFREGTPVILTLCKQRRNSTCGFTGWGGWHADSSLGPNQDNGLARARGSAKPDERAPRAISVSVTSKKT